MDLTVGLAGSGADRIIAGTAEDEINQALADVGAAGGGSVALLQGTYSLASGIWIDRDNVTLKGAGAGQSILQTIAAYSNSASPIIEAFGVDNFTIQGLTVDGHSNDILTNGIMTVQCTNGVIAECEVKLSENHNYGIWVVLSQDIQVLDNSIDGFTPTAGQEGIETWASDNILISGNTITNIGGAGINLGSVPTPDYGDIEGHNTNIQVLNNAVTNSYVGTSVGLAGPRSFGQIEIQGNTFSNVAYGVRLLTVDGLAGSPDSESADIDHPQSLLDIDISNNQINLYVQSGSGILLQNSSSPGVVSFSNIDASNNVVSNAPGQAFSVFGFDHFTLDGNIITGTGQYVSGSPYNDTILGSGLANVLVGGGGTDSMLGGLGDDTYYVDSADDVIGENANEGNDTVFATSSYTLSANVELLSLANGTGIQGTGNAGNNVIWGNGLNNVLVGGGGTDVMAGGLGDDTYYVDSADDVVGENANEGTDTVFATSSYTLSANVELLSLANGTGIQAGGNAGNNWIWGNGLANVLVGGGGTDSMLGGLGDDTYYVDSADDVIGENANEGNDTVFATSSYTLSANVELLSLANGTGIQGTGNAGNNVIWGNGLNNVLVGGGGTDVMAGGLGDDTYYVDSADDVVGENANEGTDTVFATSSYTLSANVERLSLANGTGIRATGNAGNNWISGNGLNNVLDGGGGTDTVDYSSATQAVVVDLPRHIALGAQIGTDTLSSIENVTTGSGNDAVAGDGAANVLDGGAGTDTVSYYAVSSGVVLDLAAQIGLDGTSTDTLLNFENANGTGYNDAISGTAAANVLDGLGGIDTISYYRATQGVVIDLAAKVAVQDGITDTILNFENANGSAYNDAISGNAGANVLDGLGGIDTLSYYTSSQGLVIDLARTMVVQGSVIDTVRNFENVNATSQNDAVAGNAAANVLNGLGGNDTISYYASAQAVTIDLSAGTGVSGGVTDTLFNFENINGSAFADIVTGDGGANVLNGLGGADTLTGGGDFDVFEFWTGQANGDVITDFTGNGAAAGDAIKLVGFGTATQGATFTQLNATQWQIHSGLDQHNEIITLSNGAAVHGSDFFFV